MTDPGVPVENSMLFADALRKAGVPFEFHLYEQGPHGFGLAPGQPDSCFMGGAMRRLAQPARIYKTQNHNTRNHNKMKNNNKLDRRNFLKTSAIGAAGISLIASSAAEIPAESPSAPALPDSISTRRIFPLNHKWLYSEKASPGNTATGF